MGMHQICMFRRRNLVMHIYSFFWGKVANKSISGLDQYQMEDMIQ